MRSKKYVIGASGGGAESDVFPNVLRKLFHLPLRIVTGYPGGTEIILAMERREVDGRCGWSWPIWVGGGGARPPSWPRRSRIWRSTCARSSNGPGRRTPPRPRSSGR